ncbi:sialate O-acetylesterase [Jiulongibacter sp. NS-SX5]|uniref:sialate O-acetylesterase n=1 Tax=Jiulongibacter sp. NS-SX5 TaxID=3463854 RepID=UPI00405A1C87
MKLSVWLLMLYYLFGFESSAQIVLPKLVSDGMVLQREKPVKIWGWSSPKERIILTFDQQKFKTKADESGNWEITLPAHNAGGPFEFVLKGKNEIRLENVLFGDVWLAAGQSNMVHQMQHHDVTYAKDIAEASNSQIRQFLVPTTPELNGPLEDFKGGSWKEANPENVREFSAAAYFFAQQIYEEEKVPIGIINASVGGTPIEAWTSEEGLADFEELTKKIQQNKDEEYVRSLRRAPSVKKAVVDRGLTGENKWFELSYEPKNWRQITVPGYWEDQGLKDLNGTVWYRKEVDVPEGLANDEAKIFIGRVIDADEVYINGEKVGGRTYQYPQRIYPIDPGVLKAGKNTIVVKVTNYGGKGGFVPDKPYYIASVQDTVSLTGTWSYKIGEVFYPGNSGGGYGFSAQNQPTALYNGMVAPAENYGLKGILWYQGESNTGRPFAYEALQKAQVVNWREQFKQGELPFIYVQLPNFMDYTFVPTESNWAQLRESQRKALSVSNTAMVVGIDLGEWNDIHPDDKKSVGERMALSALKLAYGKDIIANGPTVSKVERVGDEVLIHFDHVAGALQSKDGEEIREFALAEYDKQFKWADVEIDGESIVLKADGISQPRFIRYAWANNPDVNLINGVGLPAVPFEWEIDEPKKLWQGRKAAVVLTYDDALNVHLDKAIPALNEYELQGTFYLTAFSEASSKRVKDWKRAASYGHELGNHTLYHPCDARKPGRSWLTEERDLGRYTTQRIVDEVSMTNTFLNALDGKLERTFAYTCGDTETREGSFVDAIADDFVALRGVEGQLNIIGRTNLKNVYSYGINGESGDELIALVKKAEEENALITFLFHGVGGEHSLNVSEEAHAELVKYLGQNKDKVWTTTMLEAAHHVKEFQD